MKIHNLQTCQISNSALEWLKQKYNVVDSMNAEEYRNFLAPDCQLQFGNSEITRYADDVIINIKQFWETINGLNHSFINILLILNSIFIYFYQYL